MINSQALEDNKLVKVLLSLSITASPRKEIVGTAFKVFSVFSNLGTASFTFSTQSSNPVTHGANALKIDNEIIEEQKNMMEGAVSQEMNASSNTEVEQIIDESSSLHEQETSFTQEALNNDQNLEETQTEISSNGLEEFGVDMDEPDLFNTSSGSEQSEPLLLEDEQEEDDLEIPAFLRRQKN